MQNKYLAHHNALSQALLNVVNVAPATLRRHYQKQAYQLFLTRLITENVFILLLQYTGLMFSTLSQPFFCWIGSGTACAFIFLRGASILPGIWAGSFIAYYSQLNVISAAELASMDCMQAFLLLFLSYRYVAPTLNFYHRQLFLAFILLSSVVTALYSSIWLTIYPIFSGHPFWSAWLANVDGLLIFSFAIITWDMYFSHIDNFNKISIWRLASLFSLVLASSILLVFSITPQWIITLSLSLFALTMIASRQYSWCGTIAACFSIALILCIGANVHAPFFVTALSMDAILYVQILLGLSLMIGLNIAIPLRE